jgi:hypothetical protein
MKTAWFLGMRVREAMRDLGMGDSVQARADAALKGVKGKRLTNETTRSARPGEPPF